MEVSKEKCEPGLEDFLEDFLKDRRSETIALKSALADESKNSEEVCEDLRKIGHKWKGFAAPYGFMGLIEFSQELSRLKDDFKADTAEEILSRVETYLNEKESQLKREGHV